MISWSRLNAVLRKEIRQMRRDRLTFAMIVGIPLMQILLFGYAINMDVRNLSAAVADEADTHLSREFVAALQQTQVVNITQRVETAQQLEQLLRTGNVSVGVYLPEDFDRRVVDTNRVAVQLMTDGSDPTIGNVVGALRSMPIGFDTSRQSNRNELIEVRTYYNPERRSAVNTIPGLIGVILTMTMTLFTAVAIVRERERGNLEFLINTPVSGSELMVGKVIPYVVIGVLQLSLTLLVGDALFDIPIRGSIADLYVAASLFIVANLALGLIISTAASTQFQAMQMTFFLLLPSILLSGFVFPFDGMPDTAQYIGEALPITHFIRMARGIMLREAELAELSGELIFLAAFSVLAITAASLRFSRRLD